ncbi:hypothetical protein K443DRAFT_64459, partial [Laccaria amethystina LaAM-08-1]
KLPLITAVVGTMQFSPNGRYLAVGDDDGNLLIRETIKNWPRIRYYQTGAEIRGIAWDPSTPRTLFVGSRNGNAHMITFDVSLAKRDVALVASFDSCIHAVAVNECGTQVAIAYGLKVAVVERSFDDILLVVFFGTRGMMY